MGDFFFFFFLGGRAFVCTFAKIAKGIEFIACLSVEGRGVAVIFVIPIFLGANIFITLLFIEPE